MVGPPALSSASPAWRQLCRGSWRRKARSGRWTRRKKAGIQVSSAEPRPRRLRRRRFLERWHTGRVARGAAHAGTLLVRDGGGMPESGGARRQRGGDARKGDGEGEGEGRRAHAPRGRDVPFRFWSGSLHAYSESTVKACCGECTSTVKVGLLAVVFIPL